MKRLAFLVLLMFAQFCVVCQADPFTAPTDKPAEVKTPPVVVPVVVVAPPGTATGAEIQKAADDTKKAIEDAKKTPPAEDYWNNFLRALTGIVIVLAGNYAQSHWRGVFGSKAVQDAVTQVIPSHQAGTSITAAEMEQIASLVTANVIKALKGQP